MKKTKTSESGFALLMTLIVVTVVVSIGLTILDLSVKQVRLSTNAKDSEIAFHAANAGMECAKYVRHNSGNLMETGQPIAPNCFSGTATFGSNNNPRVIPSNQIDGDGEAYVYNYAITWESGTHCSQITAFVATSTDDGDNNSEPITIEGIAEGNSPHIPGYPGGDTKTCGEGQQCTILSVRGYNKPCNQVNGYGVVQREVLLQF